MCGRLGWNSIRGITSHNQENGLLIPWSSPTTQVYTGFRLTSETSHFEHLVCGEVPEVHNSENVSWSFGNCELPELHRKQGVQNVKFQKFTEMRCKFVSTENFTESGTPFPDAVAAVKLSLKLEVHPNRPQTLYIHKFKNIPYNSIVVPVWVYFVTQTFVRHPRRICTYSETQLLLQFRGGGHFFLNNMSYSDELDLHNYYYNP